MQPLSPLLARITYPRLHSYALHELNNPPALENHCFFPLSNAPSMLTHGKFPPLWDSSVRR